MERVDSVETKASRIVHAVRLIGIVDVLIGVFMINFLAIEWFDSLLNLITVGFSLYFPLNVVSLGILGVYGMEIWCGSMLVVATCHNSREDGRLIFNCCEKWLRYSRVLQAIILFECLFYMMVMGTVSGSYLILSGIIAKGLVRICGNYVVRLFMNLVNTLRVIWLETLIMGDPRMSQVITTIACETSSQFGTNPNLIVPAESTQASESSLTGVPVPVASCPDYEPPPSYEEATASYNS